jgi:hypothetical protein
MAKILGVAFGLAVAGMVFGDGADKGVSRFRVVYRFAYPGNRGERRASDNGRLAL